MTVDESDETLRRIAFGRGSSPAEVRAASDELQRRAAAGAVEAVGPAGPAVEAAPDAGDQVRPPDDRVAPPPARPRRGGLVGLAAAAVIGCGLGVAGTVGYYGTTDRGTPVADPATEEGRPSMVSIGGDQTVYQVPVSENADSTDVDRWFAGPQAEQDVLPLDMGDIDPLSARYVGRIGDDAGAWIARSVRGEYCAVLALDDGVTGGTSCARPADFLEGGASIGIVDITMFWNASTVILSTERP